MRRTLLGSLSSLKLLVIAAIAILPVTACSSSKPQVEEPTTDTSEPAKTDSSPPEERNPGEATTSLARPDGTAKAPEQDDRIPDDYTMTPSDCVTLGDKLTSVVRAENVATINPKVSAQKRQEAEENIDRVATKLGHDLASQCQNGQVGKVVDRASLKCAMDARTSKAFEACIQGDPEPAPPKKK